MADNKTLIVGNDYFEVGVKGGAISLLRLDPSGRGQYGRNITKGLTLRYHGDEVPNEERDYLVPGWKIRATGKTARCSAKSAGGGAQMLAHFQSTAGAGKAKWQITLDGNKLRIRVEGTNFRGIQLLTPWMKEGFNTKDPRFLFSRVYTQRGVYIPVEQFKRVSSLGYLDANRWRRGKKLSKWTYFTGNGNFDLRFTGYRRRITFVMDSDTMAIIFGADETGTVDITMQVLPHTEELPDCYPRFTASDERFARLLTDFYLERAFSFSNTSSSSSFNKVWVTDAMCWTDAPQNHEDREFLENMPLGKTGWVYSHAPNNEYWPLGDYDVIDTRHYDSNGMYIVAARDHFMWHRDGDFLKKVLPKMRAAMKCQLEQQGGRDGILIDRRNKHQGFTAGVGDNYWDVLPFGYKEGYSNIYYYASLGAMAEVEAMAGNKSRAEFLRQHARKVKKQYNQTFWDAKKGRYIGCIDARGMVHDFGFTFVNLEAMAYGLANPRQVRKIYNWMENGSSATGRRDIYSKWKFAPRATTIRNSTIWRENPDEFKPWWSTDYPGFNYTGKRFGDQIQDGGTSLYISYYDIVTRMRFFGVERSWPRFSEIMARYSCPDKLCGGPLMYCGENPQHGIPGSVGTDRPFPESGAVPASFLYAFIGASADSRGLSVKPNLPAELEHAGVKNLYYAGHRYDLRVSRDSVEVVRQSDGKTIERKVRPGGAVLIKPDEK